MPQANFFLKGLFFRNFMVCQKSTKNKNVAFSILFRMVYSFVPQGACFFEKQMFLCKTVKFKWTKKCLKETKKLITGGIDFILYHYIHNLKALLFSYKISG